MSCLPCMCCANFSTLIHSADVYCVCCTGCIDVSENCRHRRSAKKKIGICTVVREENFSHSVHSYLYICQVLWGVWMKGSMYISVHIIPGDNTFFFSWVTTLVFLTVCSGVRRCKELGIMRQIQQGCMDVTESRIWSYNFPQTKKLHTPLGPNSEFKFTLGETDSRIWPFVSTGGFLS